MAAASPELNLRLVNLPGYSPDFNADEAVWGWAREEATGNLCLGTKALGKGEGRELPPRAVHQARRSQAALPDHPAIKGRKISARIPAQSPMYRKCTSHLGFGLVEVLNWTSAALDRVDRDAFFARFNEGEAVP